MKNILFLLTFLTLSLGVKAQKDVDTMRIKTSAICDECKERIEKTMAYEKGVKKASLDVKTKVLTVVYRPDKTSPDKIRKAVIETGYDADGQQANPEAYQALPACCKKDGKPEKP